MAWQHRDINIAETGHSHRHHRDQTPPARHGGYPSPSRHSVERETRYPDTRSTPGSRSRSRGHSRERRGYSSERGGARGYSRSGTSPSSTDNTTEDTTETDSHTVETVDRDRDGSEYHGQNGHMQMPGFPMMVGYPMMAPPQLAHVGPMLMPGTGSIRSVQSVPMLNGHHTWDGEPCPVHHQHQHPM